MKTITKRSVSIVLSLVLCFSLVFGVGISAQAATVDYVYVGSYTKNWGTREVIATFLSPKAEAFYQKNSVTYIQLASLSGNSNEGNIPSSSLYQKLYTLMESNHELINTEKQTKSIWFSYTDCQNSGSKISSFYSGKEIGPNWDSGKTWNREHTWPNSKGNKAGAGEEDMMMLRPTSVSENSSRGNRAYGKSSGYYNPNSESNGKHDLRGDVARIILYQYVRWNCTNTGSKYNPNGIFGTSGVIESRDVMLEWIKDDPVDTWELGRNDSVESITGTRNVFVDYPELAFVLFGEQVPSDYITPSGNAKNGTTPTPTPDNNNQNNNQNSTPDNSQNNNQNTTPDNNQNNNQNTTPDNNQNNNQNNTQNSTQNTTSSSLQNNNQSNSQSSNKVNTSCKHSKAYKVDAEDARCETEGYTEGRYCPDCKVYISGHKLVEATGHIYAGDCDVDCDMCSITREVEAEHTYDHHDACMVCSISKEDAESSDTTTGTIADGEGDEANDNKTTEKGRFPWWIVIIAVVVVAGGVALVIVFREKIWPKKEEQIEENQIDDGQEDDDQTTI